MPFEKTHLLKFFSSRVLGQSRSPAIPVFTRARGASTLAVTVGFEPTVGGYPTQLFESCTFGRSDTSPSTILRHAEGCRERVRAAR